MKRTALILTLCLAMLTACAVSKQDVPIAGLADVTQDAGMYHGLNADTTLLPEDIQQEAYARLLKEHFSPWERTAPKHTADEAFWGFDSFGPKQLYGENTLLRSRGWMDRMREYSRIPQYPSLNRRAIAVNNTSMRVFPTHEPAFMDFKKAGEGYPFDYIQNSLVLAGTPLYAAHLSADRAWVLVESRFAFGWVPITDIGWVDDGFASIFMTGAYAAIMRDDVPIMDTDGNYRFTGHVGTLLPIMQTDIVTGALPLIIPVRNKNGSAIPMVSFVPTTFAEKTPIAPTPANFTRLINAMLGRPYGWGGLYEDRDCSASLMDLMVPFGIYLPRNSSQQIKEGTFADMETMSHTEKKQFMVKTGTPFLTLVRKPGHIMLYIGQKDGEPVIFHSVWGIKTEQNGKYGRRVIGGAVISTLEAGHNLPDLADKGGNWLDTVRAISTLPGTSTQ
ncbi:NlpC/P60 family N-terminal domain-containing protein [Pseudodesulfovibrio sp. zrk46]|uniref:SH3 domain-containing protein n=1 Tax=Pseudodesulfovibrio sp. zrk46 TaxID=2725288 RepID=UPI001448D129|nr:NlpC/P60 family N-terminal domain-containing protein [Pseudodesulfovibrio sp. zrk46]QJB56166.1 glycoside hydrolase [Pseudodesulfovibrio sp. zrk46]